MTRFCRTAFDLALLMALPFGCIATAKPLEPIVRKDLEEGLAAVICTSSEAPSSLPIEGWQHGVYDAQIEGQLLKRTDGLAGRLSDAEDAARSIARVKRYRGLAVGTCKDGSLFAAATPSGRPLIVRGTVMELPMTELTEQCQDWRIDYAASHGGRPRHLGLTGPLVETRSLKAGIVSITCQPRTPRWQGPVLWFLYPVGSGPDQEPPYLDAASKTLASTTSSDVLRQALVNWINQVRTKEGLNPVALTSLLQDQAELLAIDGNLTHNRLLLQRSVESLGEKNWHFLGEDRVKGKDLREMTWLLWNSPRHRDLILSDAASGLGIGIKKIGQHLFAVIILGDGLPQVISSAKTPQKKEGAIKKQ